MVIKFNQGANREVVLGDDLAENGRRWTVAVQQLGGRCISETVPLAGAANARHFAHGNITGSFVFTATTSYATLDDLLAALVDLYALIGTQDTLTVTRNQTNWIFENALLTDVSRAPGSEGVKLVVQYNFAINTVKNSI